MLEHLGSGDVMLEKQLLFSYLLTLTRTLELLDLIFELLDLIFSCVVMKINNLAIVW
jgi:hypothetical protein